MGAPADGQLHKKLCLGLMAHVDAGKTSLAEAMLYVSGQRRTFGRVDRGDAFLDHDALERARGITIFSKIARLSLPGIDVTLLDTPGHADLGAETERAVWAMDAAILVISASEGVQSHTKTLWDILEGRGVPVFLFVNKMDQPGADAGAVLAQLQEQLDSRIVPLPAGFGNESGESTPAKDSDAVREELALCNEELMETVLAGEPIRPDMLARAAAAREWFPCCFGSALRLQGIEQLLDQVARYAPAVGPDTGAAPEPAGRIFKITRDAAGLRLTHVRLTRGTLRVRDTFPGTQEKISQIRLYSGEKYEAVNEAAAGEVFAVQGLAQTVAGQAFGEGEAAPAPVLQPVLSYDLQLSEAAGGAPDAAQAMRRLRELADEEPQLGLRYDEETGTIRVLLMGAVQREILQSRIKDRFGWDAQFSEGSVLYRETVAAPAEGVGHYEPLRHYAEVHVWIEPGAPGSGITAASALSTDVLEERWQRLIRTHLLEKEYRGVLTGSPLTDVKITLVAGRAHEKHTEGGDFRQATYRAVRQGLMETKSVLLEPVYAFTLSLPEGSVGRAMNDLERLHASFEAPALQGGEAVLTGRGPAATLQNYQEELTGYTAGRGRIAFRFGGYEPCHNAEEVIAQKAYDPEADMSDPCGSVFCSHGAGFYVPWEEVPSFMHADSGIGFYRRRPEEDPEAAGAAGAADRPDSGPDYRTWAAESEELKAIFERTYGPVKVRIGDWDRPAGRPQKAEKPYVYHEPKPVKEYLPVDGYNVIFAWPELSELAKADLGAARGRLADVLSEYRGLAGCEVILVFDAYRVAGHAEETVRYHGIYIVYTKEAETADRYIEKTAHEIGRKFRVTVATSDGVEQVIIRGAGCGLLSSRDLKEEIERRRQQMRETHLSAPETRLTLGEHLSEQARETLRGAAEEKGGNGPDPQDG